MLIMESGVYSYIASVILLWHRLLLVESSVNLALNKSTSQSSNFKNLYPSSNAVDGLNKQCVNDGFAHTLDGEYEWWQVDLGEMCEIRRIQIYYRTTTPNRLDGYAIDIIKSLDSLETWQCYKDTDNTIPTDLTPSHICPSLGRYVKFSREKTMKVSNAYINLCELEVYGCPQSRYGNGDCNSSCSVGCLNFRCDPDNGNCNCSSGLVSGDKCDNINCNTGSYLQGDSCVSCSTGCVDNNCNVGTGECTKGCKPSFYGTFCNLNCTQNCYNTSCARDTGQCIGCKVGFYGDKCDKICPRNCKDKVCKQDNGYCTNCTHPYKGNTCTECVDGYFGNKCTNCSEGCLERTCDQKNGQCTCKESFFGNTCNQSCPENCKNNRCNQTTGNCVDGCKKLFVIGEKCNECVDGYYGDKCTNCSEGCFERTCDKINGQCTCKESFFGNTCNQSCSENCKNNRCNQTTGDCVDGCKKLFVIGEKCNECSDGFYGISCNLTCSKTCNKCIRQTGLCALLASDNTRNSESQTQTTNTGPIIGGVVAVIVVMVIVVVIVLFLRRRRRNSGKENRFENQITFSLPKPDHELKDEQKKSNNTDTAKENVVSVENGNDYCNPSDVYMNLTLTEVSISELSSIISKKTAEREFESEYKKLPKGSKHPTTVGKHPDNKIKNRFLTTFPYDHSRVVLKPITTEQKSDYINANYIDGAEIKRAYIATQGPKISTLYDFWKMVWQEKSGKIVMLTNLIENEKPKCEQYWPDIGQEKDLGPLKVTLESEKEYAFFVERTLLLTNKETKDTREIMQLHYTMWPDHGTPDPVQLVLFHRKVKDVKSTLTGPPIIHCAAGIGRTGTFIALDTLHDYGDKTGRIDIFEYVIRMRKDRMNMIQTLEQYMVLHEALLESFQYTGRSLSQNKFLEVCNELNETKPKNQTHVYKEFQNLSALRPVYGIESYDSALEKDNRRNNRNQNILAVEKYRPFLMSQHSSRSNFINAVMLPTFRKKCGYFVTHYPLENTVVDFWCMVFDHDSSTVVVLDEISDKDNVLHWYPDDETEMTLDSFQIKKVSGPHIYGRVREIKFTVTHQDDEKPVRMLMIRPWPAGRCVSPDKNDLLKLIEMTMTRETTDSGPVTIVCSDGARCCGIFCTVSNVILNLRIEDEIDVFHTVRQLQIRRPQFITDYEEYKSCYEVVKLFLESSNIYANV